MWKIVLQLCKYEVKFAIIIFEELVILYKYIKLILKLYSFCPKCILFNSNINKRDLMKNNKSEFKSSGST